MAETARDYAILSVRPSKFVAKSTRNQRLAIISSFYLHAAQNFKISFTNPLEMVERSRVESYGNSACPLEQQEAQERLATLAAKEPNTLGDRREPIVVPHLIFPSNLSLPQMAFQVLWLHIIEASSFAEKSRVMGDP